MEATVWFENGKLNKKRSSLQANCSSQPVLRFRSLFTENSWSTDPFVLFQNSIRYEIQDLCIMLGSTAYRIDAVQVLDIQNLQKWIVQFSQMVSMYFTVQEKVIYPTALRRQKETNISVTDLQRKTQPLILSLIQIHKESLCFVAACQSRENKTLLNFDNDTLHQSLQQLSKLAFSFVSQLEQFFAWEIEHVAKIVSKHMSKQQTKDLGLTAFRELLNHNVGEEIFAGYSQWIPANLKAEYHVGIDVFKMNRLRRKEKKWFKTHKSLQENFAKR